MLRPAGLMLAGEQRHFDGPMFQLQSRRRRGPGVQVLAEGGRHDPLLADYWSQLAPRGVPPPAAAAVTFSLDALTEAVSEEVTGDGCDTSAPCQVVVTGGGDREAARRQAGLCRQLREAGISVYMYSGADSSAAVEQAVRWASECRARVLLLPDDSDMVRVRPLHARKAPERAVCTDNLLTHLSKLGVSGKVGPRGQ